MTMYKHNDDSTVSNENKTAYLSQGEVVAGQEPMVAAVPIGTVEKDLNYNSTGLDYGAYAGNTSYTGHDDTSASSAAALLLYQQQEQQRMLEAEYQYQQQQQAYQYELLLQQQRQEQANLEYQQALYQQQQGLVFDQQYGYQQQRDLQMLHALDQQQQQSLMYDMNTNQYNATYPIYQESSVAPSYTPQYQGVTAESSASAVNDPNSQLSDDAQQQAANYLNYMKSL